MSIFSEAPHNAHVRTYLGEGERIHNETQVLRPGFFDRAFGNGVCRDPIIDKLLGKTGRVIVSKKDRFGFRYEVASLAA